LIESIKAVNFQSLQNVEVEFGKLTVIVGASSSGKSAITRAMKAVTSNGLDSDNITRGTKKAAVSLSTGDAVVTIERETGGSSAYKVAKAGSQEQVFTKLNRAVPTEVTEALGILPSTQEVASINFAGQFDTPYLLKEGASSVARVLGELTNVSKIFEAVREASRRGKNASSIVNLRKKDQAKLLGQISDYADVAVQAKSISKSEEILVEATRQQVRIDLLVDLLDRATMASKALSAIKEIPELPGTADLVNTQRNLNNFKDMLREVANARQVIANQTSSIEDADSAILLAEKELHDTLVRAGKCPTCDQEIVH
jgi:predicted ATP-dependent endonuclease of OLD family